MTNTPPNNNKNARILVVDDEPDIRSALASILRMEDYTVEEADSGHTALMLLEQRSYDLMILDLLMPGIDGVEVMRRAHKMYPDLLIIILTGNASIESAVDAVKLRAVDYLFKPVQSPALVQAVAKALQKRNEQIKYRYLVQKVLAVLNQIEAPSTIEMVPLPQQTSDTSPQIETPPTPEMIAMKRFLRAYPLLLDRDKRLVMLQNNLDRSFELTENEMAVLASLMTYPDKVMSCQELVRVAWDRNLDEDQAQSVIRPYIFRLRRKNEKVFNEYPSLIRTIRGRGYLFASTVHLSRNV